MSARGTRAAFCAATAMLVACAAPTPRAEDAGASAAPVAQAAPAKPIISASHEDWRALQPAPFGSTLSQVQFPMNEVILFQGEQRATGGMDDQECYSKSGSAFAFRGTEVEDYVVCFFHERLFRVEAALRLPKDSASDTFAQWCEDWLSGLGDVSRGAERCTGREGETQFSATIDYESELAGPLITIVVADIPALDAYERRLQKTPLPNQP